MSDPEDKWFAEQVSEMLINDLIQIKTINIKTVCRTLYLKEFKKIENLKKTNLASTIHNSILIIFCCTYTTQKNSNYNFTKYLYLSEVVEIIYLLFPVLLI